MHGPGPAFVSEWGAIHTHTQNHAPKLSGWRSKMQSNVLVRYAHAIRRTPTMRGQKQTVLFLKLFFFHLYFIPFLPTTLHNIVFFFLSTPVAPVLELVAINTKTKAAVVLDGNVHQPAPRPSVWPLRDRCNLTSGSLSFQSVGKPLCS